VCFVGQANWLLFGGNALQWRTVYTEAKYKPLESMREVDIFNAEYWVSASLYLRIKLIGTNVKSCGNELTLIEGDID
jgi:hypothetical protein